MVKRTEKELDALKTPRGGYDAKTLKMLGVPWPPPKGWRQALLNGDPIPENFTNAGKKLVPLADFIARNEVKNAAGSHVHTCHKEGCAYPACGFMDGPCAPIDRKAQGSTRADRAM